jgi:hypothetical protein
LVYLPFFYSERKKIVGQESQALNARSEFVQRVPENMVVHDVPRCEVLDKGLFRKELRSEVPVISSPDRLWQVLLEYQGIAPKKVTRSIPSIQNTLSTERISYALIVRGKSRLSGAKIIRIQNGREIGWRIRKWIIPGLVQREQLFQIVPHADGIGVKLIQHETLSGLMVPLLENSIRATRRDI